MPIGLLIGFPLNELSTNISRCSISIFETTKKIGEPVNLTTIWEKKSETTEKYDWIVAEGHWPRPVGIFL